MEYKFDTYDWKSLNKLLSVKYRKSGFSAFTKDEIQKIETFINKNPKHPGGYIIKGYVAWNNKCKDEAQNYFIKAKELLQGYERWPKGFHIGINSWLPSLDNDLILPDHFFPKAEDVKCIKKSNLRCSNLVILASCDEGYFQAHGRSFIALTQREFFEYHVHLHIINPSIVLIDELSNIKFHNLAITYEVGEEYASRPYYATSRFIIANIIMDLYECDVYIVDVDVLPSLTFNNSLARLQSEVFDIACPAMTNSWMPWNNYIACSVFIKNTKIGKSILSDISRYAAHVYASLDGFEEAWWVDQNALYWAITEGKSKNQANITGVNRFGRLIIGPEGIAKKDYSRLLKVVIDSSNNDWSLKRSSNDIIKLIASFDKLSFMLFERILFICLSGGKYDLNLLEHMLWLYHKNTLDNRLIDCLIAVLLNNGFFRLAYFVYSKDNNTIGLGETRCIDTEIPLRDATEPEKIKFYDAFVPLLSNMNYNIALSCIEQDYAGFDSNSIKLFHDSSVRRLLKQGAYLCARNKIKACFELTLVPVGLQNSGLNVITSILKMNTRAYVPDLGWRILFWEHALPYEGGGRVNPIFSSPIDAMLRMEARCILVIKKPLAWIESMLELGCDDFFNERRKFMSSRRDILGLARFYKLFIEKWASSEVKPVFVSYENMIGNPRSIFTALNIDPINENILIPERKNIIYAQKESASHNISLGNNGLTEKDLKLIETVFDKSFLSYLEYLIVH